MKCFLYKLGLFFAHEAFSVHDSKKGTISLFR